MFFISKLKKGQSLIEILVAIGLAAVFLPAILTGLVTASEGKAQTNQRAQATVLLKGAQEAIRSVREKGWQAFAVDGTYHPQISGNSWSLASGSENINGFTRQIVISDIFRDSNGNVVSTGGTADPSSKIITATVSWQTPIASQVSDTIYLSRYLNNNAFWQNTQSAFLAGTTNNTTVTASGQVQLSIGQYTQNTTYGNQFIVNSTTASTANIDNSQKKVSVRFTAQNSKTISTVRFYVGQLNGTSPTYKVGIQADNGFGNPSGIFLTSGTVLPTAVGWNSITASPQITLVSGNVYHIVVQYSTGTIGSVNNINLRYTTPLNGLYPQTQVADNKAGLLFFDGTQWSQISSAQPLYDVDFTNITRLSVNEGNPYDSGGDYPILKTLEVGEKFTIPTSSSNIKTSSISFYAKRASAVPADNLYVSLQDAGSGQILESGTLVTAAQASSNYSWLTYTFKNSQTLVHGKTYRVFLSSPNTANFVSCYFVKYALTSVPGVFNLTTYDGTNSVMDTSSDAATWTDSLSNDVNFYFAASSQVNGFNQSGTFISSTMDAGAVVAFNTLTWNATVPINTSLKFQLAINNDNATWNYFGPDGTPASYFTTGGPIPPSKINGRYIRYQAFFTSDGTVTPSLSSVSINYSP